MILHFVVMRCLGTRIILVATSTQQQKCLPSLLPALSQFCTGPYIVLTSHDQPSSFPLPTYLSSYPGNLSNLISFTPHSQTSFKTHRS